MSDEAAPSRPWWQTILLTPALLVLFGGGIGTAVPALWHTWQAWKLGVERHRLQLYEDQKELWQRNLGCIRMKPVYTITLDATVEIGVTLCPSGDALLRYQRSEAVVAYTWVRYPWDVPAPASQHSSQGESPPPQVRMVWNQTRCISQYDIAILWVKQQRADDPATCVLESIGALKGIMRRRESTPCAVCTP